MNSDIDVRELTDSGRSEWDDFVRKCPNATFFHLSGWKRIIERTFRHKTYYLYATKAGSIEGVLPLVHIKAPLLGSSLLSAAFCVYGGPAATTAEALLALHKSARKLAE